MAGAAIPAAAGAPNANGAGADAGAPNIALLAVVELSAPLLVAPKLNAEPPNAGAAVALLLAPVLNVNGALALFDGAAKAELAAGGLAVCPNVKAELAFVVVLPKMPPVAAVVVAGAVWPKANTPLAGAD